MPIHLPSNNTGDYPPLRDNDIGKDFLATGLSRDIYMSHTHDLQSNLKVVERAVKIEGHTKLSVGRICPHS